MTAYRALGFPNLYGVAFQEDTQALYFNWVYIHVLQQSKLEICRQTVVYEESHKSLVHIYFTLPLHLGWSDFFYV